MGDLGVDGRRRAMASKLLSVNGYQGRGKLGTRAEGRGAREEGEDERSKLKAGPSYLLSGIVLRSSCFVLRGKWEAGSAIEIKAELNGQRACGMGQDGRRRAEGSSWGTLSYLLSFRGEAQRIRRPSPGPSLRPKAAAGRGTRGGEVILLVLRLKNTVPIFGYWSCFIYKFIYKIRISIFVFNISVSLDR